MNAIKGALARHPTLFNSIVGYSVFASGDVMAQRLDRTSEEEWKWDHKRSLSIGLLGIVQNGFLLRIWYRTLDKFVTPKVWCGVVWCLCCGLVISVFYVSRHVCVENWPKLVNGQLHCLARKLIYGTIDMHYQVLS